MKIGFVISDFYPVIGGAQSNCFYLGRELAKKHEVHVFTSNPGNQKNEEIIDGIHIHRSKILFRFKYYNLILPGLFFQLMKYKLDVVHLHSFGFWCLDFSVVFKRLFHGVKLVNTPHGPFMALKKYNFLERFVGWKIKFWEKILNSYYDAVIQVNPFQYKWLTKYGVRRNKIKFVANGIDENAFKKVKKFKKKHKFLISYIGRVQKYKGLDQVIKVLPYLKDVGFIIVGQDVGDKKRLEDLAKKLKVEKRVEFTGTIIDDRKLSILDASDIFVFPSEWEAFGIVILEAMARGNVIVSSKTEGGKFLVKEYNGFLFDFGNVEQLKEILVKIIKNKKLMEKTKKNNIEKAKEFKWNKIALDLEKLYLDLLK